MTSGIHARLWVLLEYEPSWFAEFTSGLGMLLWGLFALLTDAYRVDGAGLIMPILGILLGPVRWLVLARLASAPRALFAFAGSAWWILITAALYQAHGLVPAHALYISAAVQDALTLAKFSAPYTRPLLDDMMAWWRRSDAPDT